MVEKIHLLYSRVKETLHKLLTLVNLKRRIGRCTQLRVKRPKGLFIVSSARSRPAAAAASSKFRRRWEEGRGWQVVVVVKSGICKLSSQGQENMFNSSLLKQHLCRVCRKSTQFINESSLGLADPGLIWTPISNTKRQAFKLSFGRSHCWWAKNVVQLVFRTQHVLSTHCVTSLMFTRLSGGWACSLLTISLPTIKGSKVFS